MNANLLDEIDLTSRDYRPSAVEVRVELRRAVAESAAAHDGLVHIADVRPRLPEWASGPQVGAGICALVRSGHLAHTGRYRPNGNLRTRNRTRPAEVYRLVRPIPKDNA